MTAYGALISLENTIENMWISYYQSPFKETLIAVYKEVQPLQEILERLDGSSKSKSRKKVNSLDGRIKQTLWNLEDLLESLLSDGIHTGRSSDDLDEAELLLYTQLHDAVDSFIQALEDMKEEYNYEVDNMPQDDDEEEEVAAISLSSTSTRMIGLSDVFQEVKLTLTMYSSCSAIITYALVGMAGLGKTTFARALYEDPDIQRYYDCRVWITVGRKYDFNQVSPDFLAQLLQGGKKCLIVLDDVWETVVLPIFVITLAEMEDDRFIQIMLTTRAQNVVTHFLKTAQWVNNTISLIQKKVLPFLNEDESKDLLCQKVFGEEDTCPPLLEKSATKIAKNCEGLPLMIVTVAQHLSSNRDPHYWNEVAEERNSVFTDSYEEISKVLFPSYDYLPQRLKMPFLFMGVYPRGYDIPTSKIVNMLTAEGWLLDPNKHSSVEESTTGFLAELCQSYNLVLFKKKKTSEWYLQDGFTMLKTCRLHSSWRHLCRAEARNNKFFHVLNKLVDATFSHSQEEDEEKAIVIKGQRGLCLENNILFGLKEFCNSVKSYCASSTRSLLFFGPYNQYPTPIDAIGFKLLRELDALQLRFTHSQHRFSH